MVTSIIDVAVALIIIISAYISINRNNFTKDLSEIINIFIVSGITFLFFLISSEFDSHNSTVNIQDNIKRFLICLTIVIIIFTIYSIRQNKKNPDNPEKKSPESKKICLFTGALKAIFIIMFIYGTAILIAPPNRFQWPATIIKNIQISYIFPYVDNIYKFIFCDMTNKHSENQRECRLEHAQLTQSLLHQPTN